MTYLKSGSRIFMGLIYIILGFNHFLNSGTYVKIMPTYLPFPLELVYLSGVCEIVLGALILFPGTARYSAWAIIAMLLAFMPVHIHMLVNADDFASAPLWLLWARLPLQGLLILWAWWYTREAPRATKLEPVR